MTGAAAAAAGRPACGLPASVPRAGAPPAGAQPPRQVRLSPARVWLAATGAAVSQRAAFEAQPLGGSLCHFGPWRRSLRPTMGLLRRDAARRGGRLGRSGVPTATRAHTCLLFKGGVLLWPALDCWRSKPVARRREKQTVHWSGRRDIQTAPSVWLKNGLIRTLWPPAPPRSGGEHVTLFTGALGNVDAGGSVKCGTPVTFWYF